MADQKRGVPILYKIYYAQGLMYIGRTTQPLNTRLRGHFFKKPMHCELDIHSVTSIVKAEFSTVADMYFWEIYEINKHKPLLNRSDKASDELTVTLCAPVFHAYECHRLEKWKKEHKMREEKYDEARKKSLAFDVKKREMRKKMREGHISEYEYYDFAEGDVC